MPENKECIARLYKYRNALYRFRYMGLVRVFSDNLADSVGVTASQVRKDLTVLGPLGNKKGGYVVEQLISRLNDSLGKNTPQKVVVVGAGNIGSALLHYRGFANENIHIVAVFDTDSAKINRKARVPILPLEELKDFVAANDIKVGVIAVPETAAQNVLNLMVEAGIRGALNFAPIRLNAPEDFVMNNVHLQLELETVSYFVSAFSRIAENRKKRNSKKKP